MTTLFSIRRGVWTTHFGPIPAAVCVPLVKQALTGLAFAHQRGIVHRDLKPGNLMINQEGTVKVVDFGIAKKLAVEVHLTATNTTVGTPMYMAPEQIMGKPVDARTDIYAMGVVLYELLAGQVPFNADSLYEIQAAHIHRIPVPPTIYYPHIPRPVVDAVMKALQKNPADRFACAEDFMRALPELEPMPTLVPDTSISPAGGAHRPVLPPPTPVPSPAPIHHSANPDATAVHRSLPSPVSPKTGPGSTQLAPVIMTPHPAPVIAPSRPAPVVTPPQPVGGRNKPLIAAIAVALIVVIGGVAWFVMRPAAEPATVVTGAPTKPAPTAAAIRRERREQRPAADRDQPAGKNAAAGAQSR